MKPSNNNIEISMETRNFDYFMVKATKKYKIDFKLSDSGHAALNEAAEDYMQTIFLRLDQSWPTADILSMLISAADILLNQCNYGGVGYEQIVEARNEAEKLYKFCLELNPEPKFEYFAQQVADKSGWHNFIEMLNNNPAPAQMKYISQAAELYKDHYKNKDQ